MALTKVQTIGIETGISLTGVTTVTTLNASGNATFSGNVSIAGTLTYEDVTNIDSVGLITARSGIEFGSRPGLGASISPAGNAVFAGVVTSTTAIVGAAVTISESGLDVTGVVTATSFQGDGSGLSGVVSGIDIQSAGSAVGAGITIVNFASGATVTANDTVGISTITIIAGIQTAATTSSGVVVLDLDSAQDHKLTLSGVSTVTVSGGTEGESHTVRVVNSGVTTVGFSTYFLFPSGATPSIPTTSGAISLISFTVHDVGISTQLLAGASVNFS